jgi:hypothetical protein
LEGFDKMPAPPFVDGVVGGEGSSPEAQANTRRGRSAAAR